jgi:hypothetical protein
MVLRRLRGGTKMVIKRRYTALAAAVLAAGALALAAPATASAQAAVNRTAPAKATPQAGGTVQPLYEMKVGPTNSCGAFSGTLQWGGNGSILVPAYISLDGRVWNNNCPVATEYVYISYTYAGGGYNPQIGHAEYSPTANVVVNWHAESELFQYGSIKVDVCDNYHGWHCGKAVGPN